MKISFIFLRSLVRYCMCALVLIRISLNFITVIPRRIIAKDVKLYIMLSAKKISSDNGAVREKGERSSIFIVWLNKLNEARDMNEKENSLGWWIFHDNKFSPVRKLMNFRHDWTSAWECWIFKLNNASGVHWNHEFIIQILFSISNLLFSMEGSRDSWDPFIWQWVE